MDTGEWKCLEAALKQYVVELLWYVEGGVLQPRRVREECGWSQAGEEDTPLTQSDGTRSGPTEIAVAARCDRGGEGINRCCWV